MIGVFIGYIMDNDGHLNEEDAKYLNISIPERVNLTVSSEGPIDLDTIINDIKTSEYFHGYNRDTVVWMETLNEKEVFLSAGGYVIMNKKDASQLNTEYVCDAYTEEYITCTIVENRSLGGNHTKDILLVKDVEYQGNSTHYFDV